MCVCLSSWKCVHARVYLTAITMRVYQSLHCWWWRGAVCLSHKREGDQKGWSTSWTFNHTWTMWLLSPGQLELCGLMACACVLYPFNQGPCAMSSSKFSVYLIHMWIILFYTQTLFTQLTKLYIVQIQNYIYTYTYVLYTNVHFVLSHSFIVSLSHTYSHRAMNILYLCNLLNAQYSMWQWIKYTFIHNILAYTYAANVA